MSETILITGAAGQLGQRVIHHLLETEKVPAAKIIAATRDPAKLAGLAASGIATRKADFDDADSLESAFKGVDRLLIISTDALAVPGQRLKQHTAAVNAAVKAGVKHIVYTSMPSPDKSLVTFAPDHLGTENAIKTTGIPYTIIRNAWYMDNYLHGMPHNLQSGSWYTGSGEGKVANISREDCARAIAAALASDNKESATYTLTGAESLSASQIAAVLTAAVGKPLQVVNVTDEQLGQGMRGAGLPDFVADMLVSADANIRAGNFNLVTADYEKLTGRKPETLTDFFLAHKSALVA
ncbi:SDR family oxidoreductase [Rhizobium mesoamericanum]|uniref:SDR family oxidoreductase n=1 Tax=Rhizobium mesoamericanum TaxID=1079800 RepID=UPI000422B475|nr:SDR family oxidoreductase [Rhizobium mesoamericanum]